MKQWKLRLLLACVGLGCVAVATSQFDDLEEDCCLTRSDFSRKNHTFGGGFGLNQARWLRAFFLGQPFEHGVIDSALRK